MAENKTRLTNIRQASSFMSFVVHIHSYAHRVIRQDDDGDDVQQYSSYFFGFNATKVN